MMKRTIMVTMTLLLLFACASACAETVTLSFVGDCSIGDSAQYLDTKSNYHKTIAEKGYDWPFSLVSEYLENDDLTVANLEVVFTNRTQHQDKAYYLKAKPEHVNILLEGSIEIVNTVNNHCKDFHEKGYLDSLATLDEAGVKRFGTVSPGTKEGHDDLLFVDVKDIRIGFIGFTYPQDSDLKRIKARIETLHEQGCDLVIVSLHWGRETHMTPESWQMTYAKNILDYGADMIWGHHPHVIQPIQFYKGKPILYSTGNFTFGTIAKLDPSTGIFQVTYDKDEDGNISLQQLRVVPCNTQGNPDYRPIELTEPAERTAVFKKLMFKKEYKGFENPPASFLDTGIVEFENGEIVK